MNVIWWFMHRFYTKRSRRAARRSDIFKKKAEKFFRRVKGLE